MKLTDLFRQVELLDSMLDRKGIEAWGLHIGSPNLIGFGQLVDVGPVEGCTDPACNHRSHDPEAPWRKWVPPEGWTVLCVHRRTFDGESSYYVLISKDEVRWLQVDQEDFAHHAVLWDCGDDVPWWVYKSTLRLLGFRVREGGERP